MMSEAYLFAAASAADLLRQPPVAGSWEQPSALAEFRVSGLAGHLASQVLNVPGVLAGAPAVSEPISLVEHYGRVPWVGAPVDNRANVSVRDSGETIAAVGAPAMLDAVGETLTELPGVLAAQDPGRAVLLPWTGWALTLDDYLITRMMEIAVHSDDLAVSVGVPAPLLPDSVMRPVFALLTAVAAQRHGTTAVLRALSRAERAPQSVTAF